MTSESGDVLGVDLALSAVSLQRLKCELDRRVEASLKAQLEAEDRLISFMRDAWPNRTLCVLLPMIFFGILLFLIRKHLPFNPNMPIEFLPTLSLFGMFVPVFFLLYKDNKIWQRFRELHPEDALLIDQLRNEENAE